MAIGAGTRSLKHVEALERFCPRAYLEDVSASDAYLACGIGPAYGATIFRRHRGTTLAQHLTARRVEHARRLLSLGTPAVVDVAHASGFRSLSRFYEAFRAHLGATPRDVAALAEAAPIETPPAGAARDHACAPGQRTRALWVDDAPLNNIRERRALSDLGISVDCFTTNAEAHAALRAAPYAMVLSDIRRHGARETGWELASDLAGMSRRPPVVFYSAFVDVERRRLANRFRAAGLCATPRDLIEIVRREIG